MKTKVGILQVFQAVSCSLHDSFMARISSDMDLISKFCLHKTNVKLIYVEEQVELNNLRLISCSSAHKSRLNKHKGEIRMRDSEMLTLSASVNVSSIEVTEAIVSRALFCFTQCPMTTYNYTYVH